jgi:hypothetical protein
MAWQAMNFEKVSVKAAIAHPLGIQPWGNFLLSGIPVNSRDAGIGQTTPQGLACYQSDCISTFLGTVQQL